MHVWHRMHTCFYLWMHMDALLCVAMVCVVVCLCVSDSIFLIVCVCVQNLPR